MEMNINNEIPVYRQQLNCVCVFEVYEQDKGKNKQEINQMNQHSSSSHFS